MEDMTPLSDLFIVPPSATEGRLAFSFTSTTPFSHIIFTFSRIDLAFLDINQRKHNLLVLVPGRVELYLSLIFLFSYISSPLFWSGELLAYLVGGPGRNCCTRA